MYNERKDKLGIANYLVYILIAIIIIVVVIIIIVKSTGGKKEEKPKEKQTKLDKFLSDNEISKQDFLKATSLLSPLSKSVIVLYYGLKAKPVSTSEIMVKLKMEEQILTYIG